MGELCSRFHDEKARRLLAEVIWWRDNAHRIPWIPPAGDGSRYDRMMESIDPSAPKMYVPNEPPSDPSEMLGDFDDDLDEM